MSTPQTIAKDFAIKILQLRIKQPGVYTSFNKAFIAVKTEFRSVPISGLKMMVNIEMSKLKKELSNAAYDAIPLLKEKVQLKMAILTALGRHPTIPLLSEMVVYVQNEISELQEKTTHKNS